MCSTLNSLAPRSLKTRVGSPVLQTWRQSAWGALMCSREAHTSTCIGSPFVYSAGLSGVVMGWVTRAAMRRTSHAASPLLGVYSIPSTASIVTLLLIESAEVLSSTSWHAAPSTPRMNFECAALGSRACREVASAAQRCISCTVPLLVPACCSDAVKSLKRCTNTRSSSRTRRCSGGSPNMVSSTFATSSMSCAAVSPLQNRMRLGGAAPVSTSLKPRA
mmetsp:Transcript_24512/g.46473  ORF Transcript_24512/g.46473 Transcript_24512/m.46473 type:complete len:219 (+) Transcript_24512:433-1089(+)